MPPVLGGRPAGLAALLLALAPSTASATVVKAMSLVEKVEASPVVLHGTVERIETHWVVPGARLETRVTLRVVEAIKGDFAAGETVTFRRGGGEKDGFNQTAPGLAEYELGEEVIMFLEPLGASYVAIGIGIGKYGVERMGEGKFVTHDPDVAVLRYDEVLQKPMPLVQHQAMRPEPLSEFKKRLRSYARGMTKRTPALDPTSPVERKVRPQNLTPIQQ
jgi:hypothetical protein